MRTTITKRDELFYLQAKSTVILIVPHLANFLGPPQLIICLFPSLLVTKMGNTEEKTKGVKEKEREGERERERGRKR